MKRTILLTVVAAAAAVAVVGVVLARSDGGANPPRTSLAIFEKPQRKSDRLPEAFRGGTVARHFRNSNSRLLGTYRGAKWYAVPGRHHTICLAGTKDGDTFGPCRDMGMLADSAIWMARGTGPRQGGDHLNVAGIANDGFTRIRWKGHVKPVDRNSFFFTVRSDKAFTARLTGRGVETNVVEFPFGQPALKDK